MLNQNASNGTAVLFVKGIHSSSWQCLQLTWVIYHMLVNFSQFRKSLNISQVSRGLNSKGTTSDKGGQPCHHVMDNDNIRYSLGAAMQFVTVP